MIGHGPNPQQHEMWHGHILDSLVGALYIQILSDSTVLLSVSVYSQVSILDPYQKWLPPGAEIEVQVYDPPGGVAYAKELW